MGGFWFALGSPKYRLLFFASTAFLAFCFEKLPSHANEYFIFVQESFGTETDDFDRCIEIKGRDWTFLHPLHDESPLFFPQFGFSSHR
jgi:hypothetical protein